jgi:hypothetical protein
VIFETRGPADLTQPGDLGCALAGGVGSLGGRLSTRGVG